MKNYLYIKQLVVMTFIFFLFFKTTPTFAVSCKTNCTASCKKVWVSQPCRKKCEERKRDACAADARTEDRIRQENQRRERQRELDQARERAKQAEREAKEQKDKGPGERTGGWLDEYFGL